jgi:hypothetical protein
MPSATIINDDDFVTHFQCLTRIIGEIETIRTSQDIVQLLKHLLRVIDNQHVRYLLIVFKFII